MNEKKNKSLVLNFQTEALPMLKQISYIDEEF